MLFKDQTNGFHATKDPTIFTITTDLREVYEDETALTIEEFEQKILDDHKEFRMNTLYAFMKSTKGAGHPTDIKNAIDLMVKVAERRKYVVYGFIDYYERNYKNG